MKPKDPKSLTGKNKFKNISGNHRNKIILIPVYLIVFFSFFDTHAQMPVLAPYTLSLGATPFLLGLVVGFYSLFNIFGNFAGGIVIDNKGWWYPLIIGLAGVFLALLFYTQAISAYHLVMIRAGHGFMGGLLVPASLACLTANKANSTSHDLRLALFGATIGLAAVTGPLFAGIIANQFGFHTVYYSLALMMAAAAVIAFGFINKHDSRSESLISSPVSIKLIMTKPYLQGAFIFALGTMGSTGTLASFLPARAQSLGLDHAQTGMLFAAFALSAIIIQISWPKLLKPLIKSNFQGCVMGLLLIFGTLIYAAVSNTSTGLYIALIIYGTGFGLSFQGMLGLVMDNSDPAWRGRAIGIFFATYSFGVALLPPLSGLIWQNITAIFPFYTSAAVTLLTVIISKVLCSKQ